MLWLRWKPQETARAGEWVVVAALHQHRWVVRAGLTGGLGYAVLSQVGRIADIIEELCRLLLGLVGLQSPTQAPTQVSGLDRLGWTYRCRPRLLSY